MSEVITKVKAIKARLEQAVQTLETLPKEKSYYDWTNEKECEKAQKEECARRAEVETIEDAIMDLKMTVYMHDSKSPLYEAIHALPSEFSDKIVILKTTGQLSRALYLIDKFILFYSEKE